MTAWLTRNDISGQYPDSWYAATANTLRERARLEQPCEVDVCVIGAGYTGLNAALELATRGYDTVVLEAHRVGWGASGRNGGQVGSGQRLEQPELERWLGNTHAQSLWRLSEAAKDRVKRLVQDHAIDCDLTPGIAYTAHRARFEPEFRALVEHLRNGYGYTDMRFVARDEARALVRSDDVHCAILDEGAAHLHPLNYALGLARAAEQAGAHIFEQSPVVNFACHNDHALIATATTSVKARHVVLACNGYLDALYPPARWHVQPLNNFIAATAPLGEARATALISRSLAVCDSRFVVNYYRMSKDHRLLFGGGESYGMAFPPDIASVVRKRMLQLFPDLHDVAIDYAWGGTLGITPRRMPYFSRNGGQVYCASGFSGHGVAMATLAGALCARAIDGDTVDFDCMAAVPSPRFPSNETLRGVLTSVAMRFGAWRDRW